MLPTRTGFWRSATPSLLPSSLHGNSGKSRRLPLLDFALPFVDDHAVVASRARRSIPRCVPLPNRSERLGVSRGGPYNQSLHPTVSSVTAVACCPGHAATAAPAAPAGELNRYVSIYFTMNMHSSCRIFHRFHIVAICMIANLFGCSNSNNSEYVRSNEFEVWRLEKKLLPFAGTKREDVELAYGKHKGIIPYNDKERPNEYVYSIAPNFGISVKYGMEEIVMWSSCLFLDDQYHPISSNNQPTEEQLSHNKQLKERAIQELINRNIPLPWLTESDHFGLP
ncbi:MAG: hypothetical protein AABZ06_11745 [Bdellovibrionota bacterium]